MKIGQVVHSYPPHIGGIENYVYRLNQSLSENGNDARVYTTDYDISKRNIFEPNVYYCRANCSFLKNPISIELYHKLKKSNDDIYHLHGYEFFSSLLATKVLNGKPKILTQHGTLDLNTNLISILLWYPYHPFLQYVLDNVDKILVLGNKDKNFILNKFDIPCKKLLVVPNGVELERFTSIEKNNENFIKKHGLRASSFKILFVGRLARQKNAHKLIRAVSCHLKNENIEVIIIGDGNDEYMAHLRSIGDKRIHILGKINFGEELIAAYNISDLFVLLSQFEGLPTVILEAMACGLPILTTPVGNIPEIIAEGKNGFFIDLDANEKELANKIEYMCNLRDNRIKRANIDLIRERFNWKLIAKKIYKIYIDVLNDY